MLLVQALGCFRRRILRRVSRYLPVVSSVIFHDKPKAEAAVSGYVVSLTHNWIPLKFAPFKFAPRKFASRKSARLKFARLKFAPLKFAPRQSAPLKFALRKSAPCKSALRQSAISISRDVPSRNLISMIAPRMP